MRRSIAGTLVAGFVLLAACSGPTDHPHGTSTGTGTGASPSPTTPQPAVSSPKPCADETQGSFTLSMREYRFVPPCLVVSGEVAFHLHNHGSSEHNLTIVGTKLSIDVPPGKSVAEPALMGSNVPPGTYEFYCRFHRGKGMKGELHVLAA